MTTRRAGKSREAKTPKPDRKPLKKTSRAAPAESRATDMRPTVLNDTAFIRSLTV